MPEHFDIERLCRLNGQKPNARDVWTAFWRIYRICKHQFSAAEECFMVIFPHRSQLDKMRRLTTATPDPLEFSLKTRKLIRDIQKERDSK